ncbi:MAG: EamA family transporter [Herpetosiphon sp.]
MGNEQVRGYGLVVVAAALWATLGLFYRVLIERYGLSQQAVVAYRAGIAAVALLAILLIRKQIPIVQRRDWPFFIFFGGVGVAAFYLFYVAAIATGSVAQAAVLLYTAPFWIMAWSKVYGHEPIGRLRLGAAVLAFGGCVLVVGGSANGLKLAGHWWSVVWGLASGAGYAVYSVCSATATRRGYSAWSVVAISLGLGAVILSLGVPWRDTVRIATTPAIWLWLGSAGLIPSLIAPICFTTGLQRISTTNGSIIATLEPVIASVLAAVLLNERLSPRQVGGTLLVVGAVAIVTMAQRTTRPRGAVAEQRVSVSRRS